MNTGSVLVSTPSMKTVGGLVGRGIQKYTVFGSVYVCVFACCCISALQGIIQSFRQTEWEYFLQRDESLRLDLRLHFGFGLNLQILSPRALIRTKTDP